MFLFCLLLLLYYYMLRARTYVQTYPKGYTMCTLLGGCRFSRFNGRTLRDYRLGMEGMR